LTYRASSAAPIHAVSNATGEQVNCPHCQLPLFALMEGAISLYHCEQCEGQWLPGSELKRLATHRGVTEPPETAASPVSVADLPRELVCPSCKERQLQATRWVPRPGSNPIIVDICGQCQSIWFDRDEFDQLLERRPAESRLDRLSTWEWLVDSGWLFTFLGG
jgi:Zn-finger nucleic acid-binding protein